MEWMLMPYRKLYRLIEGRSGRMEFWMFFLLNVLIFIVMIALIFAFVGGIAGLAGNAPDATAFENPGALAAMMGGLGIGAVALMLVFYAWTFLTSVASIAVTVRRLHDLGLTGWVLVAYYVVLGGSIFVSGWLYFLLLVGFFVAMALPGNSDANRYGPHPLSGTVEAFA
jgi:uncharacterized membrane protein YhaH (DUF805 family)